MSDGYEFKIDEHLLEQAIKIAQDGELNGTTNKRALGIMIALVLDQRAAGERRDGHIQEMRESGLFNPKARILERLLAIEGHPLHDKTIGRIVALLGFLGLLGAAIAGYRAILSVMGA